MVRVLHEQTTFVDMFIAELLIHNQNTEADLPISYFTPARSV